MQRIVAVWLAATCTAPAGRFFGVMKLCAWKATSGG
jgi:hypothetical protein